MKPIIIAALSLLSLNAFSQISLSYSSGLSTMSPSSLIPAPDSGFIAIKKENDFIKGKSWNTARQVITLLKYSRDFKITAKNKLAGGTNVYSRHYSELKKIGKKYWFIYLEPQDNDDMGDIKAIEVNPNTLEISQPKVIASKAKLDYKITMPVKTMELLFTTKLSPSENFVCLYVRQMPKDFYLSCLDANLDPVWGARQKLENLGLEGITSTAVSDAGRIYLGYVQSSTTGYSVYSHEGKLSTYTLTLDGDLAKEVLFYPRKNSDSVAVCGTYQQGDICAGVYYSVLKPGGGPGVVTKTVFPPSLVEPLHKEGWAKTKQGKYGIYPSYTTEQVRMEDGTFGFVAEYHTMSGGQQYYRTGSLVYVYFGKSGPVFTRAPKISIGTGYGEVINGVRKYGRLYSSLFYKQRLILLYFDNPDNISRDAALMPKEVTPGNQRLVAATIGVDGSLKRQLVDVSSLPYLSVTGIIQKPGKLAVPMFIDDKEYLGFVGVDE